MFRHMCQNSIYLGSNIFHSHFFLNCCITTTGIIEILAAINLGCILLETPFALGAFLDHVLDDELVFEITLKGIHLDPYANVYNTRSYL